MNQITSFVKRQQLFTFYSLAFVLFWAAMPLAIVDPSLPIYFGILALTLSAIAVAAIAEGKSGVKTLFRKIVQWRVSPIWYVATIGLPLLFGLGVVGMSAMLGSPISTTYWSQVPVMILLLGVVAIGEEIAWRGFALPRLLARYSELSASIILGAMWALFHSPVFLPGMAFHSQALLAFMLSVTSYSILITWLYQHAKGSVLITSLFHGTVNSVGALYFGIEVARWEWLQAGVYAGAALLLVALLGVSRAHRRAMPSQGVPAEQALVS